MGDYYMGKHALDGSAIARAKGQDLWSILVMGQSGRKEKGRQSFSSEKFRINVLAQFSYDDNEYRQIITSLSRSTTPTQNRSAASRKK